jgi:uncharacterized membrane protein YeaQ/YmgE (transglycosylase-associated protein family)
MFLLNGIALILVGLAAMGFGLFLFYALLPLFYAFFGVGVGYWFGSLLTGAPPGDANLVKLLFAIGGAVLFGGSAYFLEPFRRILVGIGLGSLVGGLIASAIGLTGFLGAVIMIVTGVVGALITLAVFDPYIIVASAFGGAGLAMDGLHLIFRSFGILDRTAIADGAMLPLVIWIVAGTVGMGWQFKNIARWTVGPGPATVDDSGPPPAE